MAGHEICWKRRNNEEKPPPMCMFWESLCLQSFALQPPPFGQFGWFDTILESTRCPFRFNPGSCICKLRIFRSLRPTLFRGRRVTPALLATQCASQPEWWWWRCQEVFPQGPLPHIATNSASFPRHCSRLSSIITSYSPLGRGRVLHHPFLARFTNIPCLGLTNNTEREYLPESYHSNWLIE